MEGGWCCLLYTSISGKFYGIGATIGEENGFLKLATIAEGGPAWKSGEVDAGDLILKVGQGDAKPVDVAGYSIPDGVKLIRGENQTIVSLTLKKMDGNIKVVKLVREELKIEETFARSNILKTNGKKDVYKRQVLECSRVLKLGQSFS